MRNNTTEWKQIPKLFTASRAATLVLEDCAGLLVQLRRTLSPDLDMAGPFLSPRLRLHRHLLREAVCRIAGESADCGTAPGPASGSSTYWLCDTEQVTSLLSASVSSSVKGQ